MLTEKEKENAINSINELIKMDCLDSVIASINSDISSSISKLISEVMSSLHAQLDNMESINPGNYAKNYDKWSEEINLLYFIYDNADILMCPEQKKYINQLIEKYDFYKKSERTKAYDVISSEFSNFIEDFNYLLDEFDYLENLSKVVDAYNKYKAVTNEFYDLYVSINELKEL